MVCSRRTGKQRAAGERETRWTRRRMAGMLQLLAWLGVAICLLPGVAGTQPQGGLRTATAWEVACRSQQPRKSCLSYSGPGWSWMSWGSCTFRMRSWRLPAQAADSGSSCSTGCPMIWRVLSSGCSSSSVCTRGLLSALGSLNSCSSPACPASTGSMRLARLRSGVAGP